MFNIFKRTPTIQKLDLKYQQLLSEAHRLSTISRSQSDAKIGEAEAVFKQIEVIRTKKSLSGFI